MTYDSTYGFSDRITKNHIRFGGKSTLPQRTNANAYNILMRIRCAVAKGAEVGFVIPAQLNDGTETEIYIEPIGKDGWFYVERPANSDWADLDSLSRLSA